MNEIRYEVAAYDPALREARRMRNEVIVDLVKALFDGRLATRLFGPSTDRTHDLPRGTTAHH